ncbi:tail fiber domain-containing protein [Chryseobacterium sp.]|uniref:tail fiber domain-containing protein n=1 Tax=Chryseobacterium sp. TaxID=1871047 RepID=UPI002FC943BA
MKKSLIAILFSGLAYSQVGINTDTPNSTLDVMINPTVSKPEGIIAPRMTGDVLKGKDLLYSTAQNAALVYVTGAVSGTPAGKTIDVTSPGYYYYDATAVKWIKLGVAGGSTPPATAWYPGGNSESVEKTLGTNNSFDLPIVTNGTEKARLTTAGSLGINTTAPNATLDVTLRPASGLPEGIIAPRITGDALRAKNALYLAAQDGTLVYVTTADTAPAGKTVNVTSSGYFYYDNATSTWIKLGVGGSSGPTTPDWALGGNTVATEQTLGTIDNLDLPFITNNTEKARLTKAGFLGVGTTTPGHGIHLVSTTASQTADNITITSGVNPAFVAIQTTPTAGRALGSMQFQGQGVAAMKAGIYSTVEASAATSSLEFHTSDTEQVRIDGKGFVGVGTTTPLSKLHIEGTDPADADDNDIRLSSYKDNTDVPTLYLTRGRGTSVTSPSNLLANDFVGLTRYLGQVGGSLSTLATMGYQYQGNGTTTNGRFYFSLNGNLRAALDQSGELRVYGNVIANDLTLTSDARFKTDIATIKNALPIINSLRGTTYQMNKKAFPDRNFAEGKQYGVIAQEVEKLLPELVITSEDGYKSVNYIGMIPVLIEAVKEQQKQITTKDSKIKELEERLQKLENAVNALVK